MVSRTITTHRAYIPGMKHFGLARHTRGKMEGKGIGAVLLDGGLGGASSYDGVDDYIRTTGVNPSNIRGSGLGKSITSKLSGINIQKPPTKRKPQNINFTL